MAFISSFGAYLPEMVLDNEALAERLGVEAAWIESATGMRERRVAAADESVTDMAFKAAEACLAEAGLDPKELGGILVGSGTPQRQFPGISADLQARLKAAPGLAFDIHLASVGGLYALGVAVDLCPRTGPILVVGVDRMSEVVARPPLQKETAILFGDGAGACLVRADHGTHRVRDLQLHCDGNFAKDLHLEPGGSLYMNGMQVIMQATRKLQATVTDLLTRNQLTVEDIDLFLFHQANRNLLQRVAAGLKLEESKVLVNLDRYGNTSAASILIAAAEAQAQGRLQAGTRAVLAAFGSGFAWGSMLLHS